MKPFNLDKLHQQFQKIRTLEMHTGGEPVRIVMEGYPALHGSILSIRSQLLTKYDHLRKSIMWEPRGHADMYGLLIVPPERKDSDLGVIFMHNEGYSTMCGHATLALAHCASKMGWIDVQYGQGVIKIDAPCGQLEAKVQNADQYPAKVSFLNVPSYVHSLDNNIKISDIGNINYDIAYGGAYYAYVDVKQLDLSITPEHASHFIKLGKSIKEEIIHNGPSINHPFEPDLSFLYGVIFTEDMDDEKYHSRNVCIFADGELDRSATGSGVSGRAAILEAKQMIGDQTLHIKSIIGSSMSVTVNSRTSYGSYDAVIPEVSGESHFIGTNEFWLDEKDEIGKGFIIR